jgi:hypothetical protein
MLKLTQETLEDRVCYIPTDKLQSSITPSFDLLITNNCLSETPPEYQLWIANNIFPKCDFLFSIDDTTMEEEFKKYFLFSKEQYLNYPNIFIFKGERDGSINS